MSETIYRIYIDGKFFTETTKKGIDDMLAERIISFSDLSENAKKEYLKQK